MHANLLLSFSIKFFFFLNLLHNSFTQLYLVKILPKRKHSQRGQAVWAGLLSLIRVSYLYVTNSPQRKNFVKMLICMFVRRVWIRIFTVLCISQCFLYNYHTCFKYRFLEDVMTHTCGNKKKSFYYRRHVDLWCWLDFLFVLLTSSCTFSNFRLEAVLKKKLISLASKSGTEHSRT